MPRLIEKFTRVRMKKTLAALYVCLFYLSPQSELSTSGRGGLHRQG
jgi:hypothetical protein